ncbi:hypothetical protein PQR75_00830 [Paraburkholderia fungorum]|uniref:hypothetical protein n=1 Tax=Paraburkholderia fungorum TaxID=134537 RepID=UPI0038BDF703
MRFTAYQEKMGASRSAVQKALLALSMDDFNFSSDGGDVQGKAPAIEKPDVDSMDVFDLLYLIYKNDGHVVAGSPTLAFAYLEPSTDVLKVYTRTDRAVEVFSDLSRMSRAAVALVLDDGGHLFSLHGKVHCVMGDTAAYGDTYDEAAMRVLAKRLLSSNDASRCRSAERGQEAGRLEFQNRNDV